MGETMGTYYSVKIIAPESNKQTIQKIILKSLKETNYTFNTYTAQSEISKFNQMKKNSSIEISDRFVSLLKKSKKIFNLTKGHFDISIGPLVNAWGFGPAGAQKKLTVEDVKYYLKRASHKGYFLDGNKIKKKLEGSYLDMSSIAKGYGVDAILLSLESKGYKNIYVEIGGEGRAIGRKLAKEWKVGIESPEKDLGAKIQKVIALNNQAIATSGNYRNTRNYNGEVFSHTINPKTGYPVKHKLLSATVLSADCATADALATALMVMGPNEAIAFISSNNLRSYLIYKDSDELKFHDTLQL